MQHDSRRSTIIAEGISIKIFAEQFRNFWSENRRAHLERERIGV